MIESSSAERRIKRRLAVGTTLEAGIKLDGGEVKAIRAGRVDWRSGFVRLREDGAYIQGLKIFRYPKDARRVVEVERVRKLLLNKEEINHLRGLLSRKGTQIVPLKVDARNKYIKILLAVGRGKKKYDHRREKMREQQEREIKRETWG